MKRSNKFKRNKIKKQREANKQYYRDRFNTICNTLDKGKEDIISFSITDHFEERFKERVDHNANKMSINKLLQDNADKLEHISDDYWIMDDDLILVMAPDHNKFSHEDTIVLVTTLGPKDRNFQLYNVLISEGASGLRKFQKNYGKMDICVA